MNSFGPKKFQIPCTDQKVPFWQFFRQGRDGRALLVRPSRIPHRNSKIIFTLGADEFLVMLEGKIREAPFFKVQSGKITVWFKDDNCLNFVHITYLNLCPVHLKFEVGVQYQILIKCWIFYLNQS